MTATNQCLANFKALSGTWPPIRIGGTTQDRASYDSSTSAYVVYSVANPADAPATLTFGPNFIKLAATYAGDVTLGLNRGKNNIDNTIAAAKVAVQEIKNIYAIELGNEPECKNIASLTFSINSADPRVQTGRELSLLLLGPGILPLMRLHRTTGP